ncbi:MAG: hypothetical protein J6V20_01620 [Bacteroidaceae bacterium]|nr:hypothetical protein [Bacteroidaceae bacterium]
MAEYNRIEDIVKKQANDYIQRILIEINRFQVHGETKTPNIVMSKDVFNVLQAGLEGALYVNYEYRTVCGCEVDIISGNKKLYVGFNLLEGETE